MSCFVIELCSIGGCPLEEACEHFSLSNKIIAIMCSGYIFFAYSVFWVFFSHILCSVLLCRLRSITSGIRALSRAGVVDNYFLFLQIFFRRRKKRAATFQTFLVYFCTKFPEKGCRSEFLSEKHPI